MIHKDYNMGTPQLRGNIGVGIGRVWTRLQMLRRGVLCEQSISLVCIIAAYNRFEEVRREGRGEEGEKGVVE